MILTGSQTDWFMIACPAGLAKTVKWSSFVLDYSAHHSRSFVSSESWFSPFMV